MRGITTREGRCTAATAAAATTFQHITVTSFMPAGGSDDAALPVGVIVPFRNVHEDFRKIWPEALFWSHESGSQTAESFPDMLEQCCLRPMRQKHGDKPFLLLMDSGGGTAPHISVAVALLLHRYNAHAYVLPAYSTKALCPLDQLPHALMGRRWGAFKKSWAQRRGRDMNIWEACAGIRRIVAEALSAPNRLAGWEHCGFVPGLCLQRQKVLEDRFAEVFQSKRSGAGNVGSPKSKAAVALDLLDVVSPSRRRCDVDGCKGMVATTDRFCSKCGAPNSSYDAETAQLFQSGRKAGWHKAAKVQVVPETEAERQLARGVGDLLDAIRKRIPETSTTSVPHEAAAAPEAKDSGAQGSKAMESDASFKKSKTVPQPLPPPAAEAADDEDEDMEASVEPEWDLSKLAHCQQYIEEHFPASEAAAAGVSVAGFGRIVCFFLGELRARKGGLAHWFTKEVLSCGMLKTKASRAAWLQAWKAQRGKTFLPKSKPKRGRSGCKVCISCRFQGMGFAKP